MGVGTWGRFNSATVKQEKLKIINNNEHMPSKSIGHSDLILHVEFNSPDEKEFTVPEP